MLIYWQHQTTHEKLGLDCPEWIFEAVTADAAASAEKRQRAVVAKDQREVGVLDYRMPRSGGVFDPRDVP